MSVLIDDSEELLNLLKKLNLKVANVDELRHLLATINANYHPDAARQKTGKLVGWAVPSVMAGAAAVVSLALLSPGHVLVPYHVGILALIWGACTVVSTAAPLASFLMTSVRRHSAPINGPPTAKLASADERVVTAHAHDLSL